MKIHTFTLGPFQTNSYLIEDEATHQGLLVDPTIDSDSIYADIVALQLKIDLIVLTHGHVDHAYGSAYFKKMTGAALAIHQDDVALLRTAPNQAVFFGLPMPQHVSADRLLADGDVITAGRLSFQVVHTPGHTPGGICLYGQGVLISGDTLFAGSIGRTDLPGGDSAMLLRSIKARLLALPPHTLVHSGHGPLTMIGEEKQFNPFLT